MVKCPVCLTEQPVASTCRACGVSMGAATADAANPYSAPVIGVRLATAVPRYQPPLASHSSRLGAQIVDGILNTRYQPPLASRSSRLGAQIVDGILNIVVLIPSIAVAVLIESNSSRPSNGELVSVVMALGFLALNVYQWVLLSRCGQTLGKKAFGIKVVMYHDGSNPGFGRAVALRNWVNRLICVVPFYGLIDVLLIFGDERRCIHDHIAGTTVIEVS